MDTLKKIILFRERSDTDLAEVSHYGKINHGDGTELVEIIHCMLPRIVS